MRPHHRRQLRELPGVADGLSLTQRIVLTILAESPARLGRVFGEMVHNGREPLVFLGDTGMIRIVEAMARTTPPVLTMTSDPRPFHRETAITDTGREVLAADRDFLSLQPEPRWIGGTLADGRWRFDHATDQVIPGRIPAG